MNDCLFCKIIEEDIPSAKVYEDDKTFAFLDINPVNPGHTLVVPKKHSHNLFDIEEVELCAVMKTVKKLAGAIKRALSADGINIEMSNEPAAGQEVFHTHIHIIPRFARDGLKHWPGTRHKDGKNTAIAEKIKNELA